MSYKWLMQIMFVRLIVGGDIRIRG